MRRWKGAVPFLGFRHLRALSLSFRLQALSFADFFCFLSFYFFIFLAFSFVSRRFWSAAFSSYHRISFVFWSQHIKSSHRHYHIRGTQHIFIENSCVYFEWKLGTKAKQALYIQVVCVMVNKLLIWSEGRVVDGCERWWFMRFSSVPVFCCSAMFDSAEKKMAGYWVWVWHTWRNPSMNDFGNRAFSSCSARKYFMTCEICFQKFSVSCHRFHSELASSHSTPNCFIYFSCQIQSVPDIRHGSGRSRRRRRAIGWRSDDVRTLAWSLCGW